jgi:ribose transport system permease protein
MLVAFYIIFGFILARSVYGRALYATGGNDQAARLAGIRVDLVRWSTYVLVGAGAGAAGLIYSSLLATGNPTIGSSILLDSITVVVIGGTSLFGGSGAVWRTAAGFVLLATISNVFDLLAIEAAWQMVTKGALLITFVGLDLLSRRNA